MNKIIPEDKELYLFDIDGVLIRYSEPFSIRYGRDFGKVDALKDFFDGVFQECLIGKADLKIELEKRLVDWEWKGNVDDLLKYWFEGESEIDLEMLNIIKDLRSQGKPCYLVTNQEEYRIEHLKQILDSKSLVNGLFASSDLGVLKPNSIFFEKVLKSIGFQGEMSDIFYIDDSLANIRSAEEMGISASHYQI